MQDRLRNYYRGSVSIAATCVTVLIIVTYVMGIFLAASLNGFHIAGFPVGFWVANLGSIWVACLVSRFTAPPPEEIQELVYSLRYPREALRP